MLCDELEEAYREEKGPRQDSEVEPNSIQTDENSDPYDQTRCVENNFQTESNPVQNEEEISAPIIASVHSGPFNQTFTTDSLEECLTATTASALNVDKSLAILTINPGSTTKSQGVFPIEVRNDSYQDNVTIVPAPETIDHSMCSPPHRPPNAEIAEAPRVMSKSTGASFPSKKRGRPKKGSNLRIGFPENNDSSELINQDPEVFGASNVQNVNFNNLGNQRSTRIKTGSLERLNLNENLLHDQQLAFNYFFDSGNRETRPTPLVDNDFLVQLPLPVPEPPEAGMIISRGKWTTISKRSSRGKGKGGNYHHNGVRKHHYSPYTITGKVFSKTLATLAEPESEHQCLECPAKYNKLASLEKHIQRAHNPNLKFRCPECPKMLSCKNAIKKHLLSHRPETEW